MRHIVILALATLSFGAAAPALAQDAMASHDKMASHDRMATHDQMSSGAMRMSAADTRKMKACNAMSHDAAMKDGRCARLMKAHPDMMSHGSMSPGH